MYDVRVDLVARANGIRSRILQCAGVPGCIGIAPTETLAKLVNHIGNTAERKPGSYPVELAQVCCRAALPAQDLDDRLQVTVVGEVRRILQSSSTKALSAPCWTRQPSVVAGA